MGGRLQFFGMDQDPGTVAARDDHLAAKDFDEGLGGDADPAAPATLLFDQDHRGPAPIRNSFVVFQQFRPDSRSHLGAKRPESTDLAGTFRVTGFDRTPLGFQPRAGFDNLLFGFR